MRVEAGTRLQLEDAFTLIQGPDSREGGPHVGDEGLSTLLQGAGKGVGTGQRQANSRGQRRQLRALAGRCLSATTLRDVAQHAGKYRSPVGANGGNRQLHRNFRAIRPPGGHLDELSEQLPLTCRKVTRKTSGVRVAERRRYDQV